MKPLEGNVELKLKLEELVGYLQADCFIRLRTAAKYLDVSERFLREHLAEIRHYRLGQRQRLFFRRSDLDAWMSKHEVPSEHERRNVDALVDDVLEEVLKSHG